MHLNVPTGYLLDDHAAWGDPTAGCVLSRMYNVELPDTSASDDQTFVDLERDMRLMLGCMKPDERLQVHFYTSNDFGTALDRYEAESKNSAIAICSKMRAELLARFRDRMKTETLIQSNVRLSFSARMPKFIKENGRKINGFQDVFKVLTRSFEQRAQFFDLLLRSYGGSVTPIGNASHYEELLRYWSPGQARQPRFKDLDWLRTIDDLCCFSGLSPRREPDHGFYLDGFYVGLLVAKTMPRSTWAKTMEPFLALTIPNLRVVLNMRPLAIEEEILHEADRYSKLCSNIDPRSPSLQSEVGLEKHRERMRLLMSNRAIPFKAQLIVIACDRTPEGLDARMEALRAALGKTGAEPFQPSLASSAVSFFNCATPGIGPWIDYKDFWHKMDDALNVVHMWPAGSTPAADLSLADWITDGDQNNLIGGRCFRGSQPAHMLVAGSTGYGKSSLLQAMALQTALGFKFLVVIDDGLSWMTTCQKLDPNCRPIIVRSNGGQTFNLFDTRGLPLASQHLASATALAHLLVGRHADGDKDKLRAAILSETITEVYGIAYRRWRKDNPELHYDLCIDAAEILAFQQSHGVETFLDAYLEIKANPDLLEDQAEVDECAALSLDRDPATEHLVENLAFASWTHDMFPTLSDLQDELHTAALVKGPHAELCATLASLLRPWLRDGRYGPIVDGYSNVDLGSVEVDENVPLKVVQFELGELGESESELRAVAGFLICNEVRNHIQGMPRGIRKQVVIEEMVSFLKVPNAEQVIVDYWQKMRKYSAQMVAVFQTYSTLLAASQTVAKALISNSSSMLLLGNRNRQDLETLGSFMPRSLPEVIKDQVSRFPKPADLPKDQAYAGFVYAQLDGEKPRFTVGRSYITEEVEAITSSSGVDFERKKKELRTSFRGHEGQNGHEPVGSSNRMLEMKAIR